MEYILTHLDDMNKWVKKFLDTLDQGTSAHVVTLSGDLGSGKTTLVQHIAKNLGITETLTSPTFVIQKEYEVVNHPWIRRLVHIDAYRLEDKKDLEYLGWNTLIKDSHTLICMEWPEKVEGIPLSEHTSLSLSIEDDHSRKLVISQ